MMILFYTIIKFIKPESLHNYFKTNTLEVTNGKGECYELLLKVKNNEIRYTCDVCDVSSVDKISDC